MTIQSDNLVNAYNSNFIIPANNIEFKNTPAHVVWWNCPIDQWTTSRTEIWSMPVTILWKTYSPNQPCKVQSNTWSIRVTSLSWQAIWVYSWKLTITYSDFDDTIDCRSAVDPNCSRPDMVFDYWWATMRRAGCNSTLGIGNWITHYGQNAIWEVYDCSWINLWYISQFYSYTWKEINISPNCKIDNIFWKLYTWAPEGSWYWSDLACWFWRHIPSDSEWKTLEEVYNMDLENRESIGWRWTNQWRSGTELRLLNRDLWFPLAWYAKWWNQYYSLWSTGYYWTKTLSWASPMYREISYDKSTIFRWRKTAAQYYSVRCVRNCPSDFVCRPWERCEIDASCCKNDTKFSTWWIDYSRAWCNSTLWDMSANTSIQDYAWNAYDCEANIIWSYLWFNKKEIWMWWACKINNNFGKLYQWQWLESNCKQTASNDFIWLSTDYNCACPSGRHVPTSSERDIAKGYYASVWWINWWAGNQSWLVRKFQLPLVWRCSDNDTCVSRGLSWYYRSSNKNWINWISKFISYSSNSIADSDKNQTNYLPVRCIKD
jgi:hypothetical protein